MPVVLYREHKQVKNGWNSRIPSLRLAAYGSTPEEADENLQRLVRAFFAPFERAGTLEREMRALGLGPVEDELEFILQ